MGNLSGPFRLGTICDIGAYEFVHPSAVLLNIFISPASIIRGSNTSGPNQWFARVALGVRENEGTRFHFVVWLHVPEDWTLPWARQYSFTGDFKDGQMEQDVYWGSREWMMWPGNCAFGGPAEPEFKWRAVWKGGDPADSRGAVE